LPALGKKLTYKAHQNGVAERFPAPAVQKSMAVALALMGHDAHLLRDMAVSICKTATQHHAKTLDLRRPVPGLGESLSLVLRYEMHAIDRVPRVQDVVSSCRLVTCAQESAGTRSGTAGTKIGQASRKGAFSAAAVLFLQEHPAGPKYRPRLETKHGKGQALTVLAHQWARAGYHLLKRQTAFARDMCLTG
jgi:hypothetical protein